MLNKLSSFCSHATTKIQILVGAHYAFCRQLYTLDYIAKLLENNKFFYDDIENVNNEKHYHRGFPY